jgi:HlyD family secretion protein
VKQVRLQSTTQDNVVSYTAVISVENADGKLLPGMTTTVQFLTGSAKNVMLVPNAALRYRPVTTGNAAAGGATAGSVAAGGVTPGGAPSTTGTIGGARGATARGAGTGGTRANVGTLWYVDKSGKVVAARVRTGLTDGQKTEVQPRDSTAVTPGMQVIIGATTGTQSTATTSASSNPLQPQAAQRRGPGGPGGF